MTEYHVPTPESARPADPTLPFGALLGSRPDRPRYKGITQRTIADVRWKVIRDLMPAEELADLMGIHSDTARRRLASGAIPLATIQIDRYTFVFVAEAIDYLESIGIDVIDDLDAA